MQQPNIPEESNPAWEAFFMACLKMASKIRARRAADISADKLEASQAN